MNQYIYYHEVGNIPWNRQYLNAKIRHWEKSLQWQAVVYRDPVTMQLKTYVTPVNPFKDKKLEDYM